MMQVISDPSAAVFHSEASPLLYREEARNNLILGISEGLMARPEQAGTESPAFYRVVANGQTVVAAMKTPQMNLVVSGGDESELALLAEHVHRAERTLPGVAGPAGAAAIFAREWSDRAGVEHHLQMGLKILALESVTPPQAAIDGTYEVARAEDIDLATEWFVAFAKESLPANEQKDFQSLRPTVESIVGRGFASFWRVGGEPVSMAVLSRPTKNGITISTVYTPPASRGHGYASANVAAISQQSLDKGKRFCVLYTDPANPTSNKIYRAIGYRDISDAKLFRFTETREPSH